MYCFSVELVLTFFSMQTIREWFQIGFCYKSLINDIFFYGEEKEGEELVAKGLRMWIYLRFRGASEIFDTVPRV